MGNFSNEIQYGESTPALAQATSSIGQPSFQRHETLSVWDWMKFYESARSILTSTVEKRENVEVVTSVDVPEELKVLSQNLLISLTRVANDRLNKVKLITD